jgi:signal transduction histidine kinase
MAILGTLRQQGSHPPGPTQDKPTSRQKILLLAGGGIIAGLATLITLAIGGHYLLPRVGQITRADSSVKTLWLGALVILFVAANAVCLWAIGRLKVQRSELNRRVDQMRQLHEVSLMLASSVAFQPMLDRICQAARDITISDAAMLLLYDPTNDSLQSGSHCGYDAAVDHANPRSFLELARTVLKDRKPILVQDTASYRSWDGSLDGNRIGSLMIVPMISRLQVMGTLIVTSSQTNGYDSEKSQLVLALASQAAAAIENARLLDETMTNARTMEHRARNLLMINRISADLTSLLDPYEIFSATARHMVELMDVDHCTILIFDEGAANGVVAAEYPDIGTIGSRLSLAADPALNAVLAERVPLAVSDVDDGLLSGPIREAMDQIGVRAVLIAPLIARDQVIGTISLEVLHRPHSFSSEVQELCRTVAAQCAIAVANARLLYDTQQQSRALARKSQELIDESSRLDAVLTNMADGLVVTDLEGCIILTNPSFNALTGRPLRESFRGRPLDEAASIHGLGELIAQAASDGNNVTFADLNLPDGRALRASACAVRTKYGTGSVQDGRLMGVVTVLRDVTHEVEVDRMKTEFISAVSHELRTPLTSILGFSSLIQRTFRRRIAPLVEYDEKAKSAAERILGNLVIIETESKRLTRLINDVLDISKIESGRLEWNMEALDIGDVINSSIATTAALAQDRALTVTVDMPLSRPSVWGDFDRLVQVLTNLLANAIKFTDEGSITVRSRVSAAESRLPPAVPRSAQLQRPAMIVDVADTGIGIAAEDMPLIFERFRQGGDTLTGKPRGSGLGLSICREIVQQHGGAIWVDSKAGEGSTFSFSLPLVITTAEERAALSHAAEYVATPRADRERRNAAGSGPELSKALATRPLSPHQPVDLESENRQYRPSAARHETET